VREVFLQSRLLKRTVLVARGRLKELGGVAELPIAADVSHVVATELVDERDIEDEVG
jgi:hypothetical protein